MVDLTFGEQVKIILSRKGMTIKELAEQIEHKTGKRMSRQNLTQRLSRDNFQEQDMRMIARILNCPFQLDILGAAPKSQAVAEQQAETPERDLTVGEFVAMEQELTPSEEETGEEPLPEELFASDETEETIPLEDLPAGDINPYTGKEYETDSVRMHPSRIGYVQVYDRKQHQWTDMTEWAFLGYQERKKELMGDRYKPPVYLD